MVTQAVVPLQIEPQTSHCTPAQEVTIQKDAFLSACTEQAVIWSLPSSEDYHHVREMRSTTSITILSWHGEYPIYTGP